MTNPTLYITVDIEYNEAGDTIIGVHQFDIHPDRKLVNPDKPGEFLTLAQYIAWLNADPARRETAGWHISRQHAGEPQPITRWQRLVNHSLSPEGHPDLRAILQEDENGESRITANLGSSRSDSTGASEDQAGGRPDNTGKTSKDRRKSSGSGVAGS